MNVLALVLLWVVAAASPFFGAGVHELSARDFTDRVLYSGNATAVVFYAPWCGYCRKLIPEWGGAAKQLAGLARVAAVNCDDDSNKQLCAKYGVQGFPTIKVFQPAKLTDKDFARAQDGHALPKRRPKVFSYDGPRDGAGISKFVLGNLRNYVTALGAEDVPQWLTPQPVPRVLILPGTKYTSSRASALFRVLSRDYFGTARFATVPRTAKQLGLKPSDESQLVFVGQNGVVPYKGALKKKQVKAFLDKQLQGEQHDAKEEQHDVKEEL